MARIINSRDNPRIKYAVKAGRDRKIRNRDGVFLVPGSKAVADTARRGYEPAEVYISRAAAGKYRDRLSGLPLVPVSESVAEKLSRSFPGDGVFGLFRKKREKPFDIFSAERIIALRDVQDPVNVGAILRSALALGYSRAAISEKCADLFSPKVIRASMTASLKLPSVRVADFARFAGKLGEKGFQTVAATLRGASPLGSFEMRPPLAVFIGSEGQGLPREVARRCRRKVKIPMAGDMESLNAAVSRGIIMWETVKR